MEVPDPRSLSTLPDPTDWLATPLSPLGALDSLLRCQICKDFYTSAVFTTCLHTFCSLCIRRCLASEGRCPSCNSSEQEARLKKNVALQEVVDCFVESREKLLRVARERTSGDQDGNGKSETHVAKNAAPSRGTKRKRSQADAPPKEPNRISTRAGPRTRSQHKAASQATSPLSTSSQQWIDEEATIIVQDSDAHDDDYTPDPHDASNDEDSHERERQLTAGPQPETLSRPHSTKSPGDDGLVACPICGKRMKEELVFPHVDTCTGVPSVSPPPSHSGIAAPKSATPKAIPQRPSFPSIGNRPDSKPPPERLPQLNYSLLRDNALRKKLSDLRIPNWGPRGLLIRRHAEWLAIWNANCDSSRPKPRRPLLDELDKWERTQGGLAPSGTSNNMLAGIGGPSINLSASGEQTSRHFDGRVPPSSQASNQQKSDSTYDGMEWARNNRDEFRDLIAKARQTRNVNKTNVNDKSPVPEKKDSVQMDEPASTSVSNGTIVDKTPEQVEEGLSRKPQNTVHEPFDRAENGIRPSTHNDHQTESQLERLEAEGAETHRQSPVQNQVFSLTEAIDTDSIPFNSTQNVEQ